MADTLKGFLLTPRVTLSAIPTNTEVLHMSASNWEEVALAARTEEPAWSLATRVAFRFCFAFLLLYNFPFPLDLIPSVGGALSRVWQVLVQLVAQPLFGVDVTPVSNGSGDRTWNYIQLFLCTAIAAAVTLLWSILDRRVRITNIDW